MMAAFYSSLLLATLLLVAPSQSRTLFPYEQTQLTREYIASLPEDEAKLFGFDSQAESGTAAAAAAQCKYFPGDDKWPSEKAWTKLTKQLSSPEALIKAVPQASVCYPGATANAAKCQDLTKKWEDSYTLIEDPTSILSPLYQGMTCAPPTIYDSKNCTLGGYPAYVIKAATVLDIQVGLNFARNDGLRLVVKNTGHDFAGKSAGAGALSLWTHSMKDMQYFESYSGAAGYTGPAIKAGAGVQAYELYKFANEKGVMAVAGEGQVWRQARVVGDG